MCEWRIVNYDGIYEPNDKYVRAILVLAEHTRVSGYHIGVTLRMIVTAIWMIMCEQKKTFTVISM